MFSQMLIHDIAPIMIYMYFGGILFVVFAYMLHRACQYQPPEYSEFDDFASSGYESDEYPPSGYESDEYPPSGYDADDYELCEVVWESEHGSCSEYSRDAPTPDADNFHSDADWEDPSEYSMHMQYAQAEALRARLEGWVGYGESDAYDADDGWVSYDSYSEYPLM